MLEHTLWHKASQIQIQTGPDIAGNFSIGFDDEIPESIKEEMRAFVRWVEANFHLPVTLWVDFEYRHYLMDRNKKRVGYLFYWADFPAYPVFENPEEIPSIRLPVRTEHYTLEEILSSFIEAISHYYAWIANIISEDYTFDEEEAEEILQGYLAFRAADGCPASE